MFFLVPYHLIDREDLSLIQKMCILYLARHYDEKGDGIPINELELAEKLRISTSEVRLNLEVLLSKGIIDIDNKILPEKDLEEGKEIIVKDAVFKDFNLDGFQALKNKLNNRSYKEDLENGLAIENIESIKEFQNPEDDFLKDLSELDAFKDEDSSGVEFQALAPLESPEPIQVQPSDPVKDSKESPEYGEDYEAFLQNISKAEERIKERASKLKLNVRRENRREKYNQNKQKTADSEYNRRKSDKEKPKKADKDTEADQLLNILAASNKNLLDEKKNLIDQGLERRSALTNKRPGANEAKKKVNPKFMQASSVYKRNEIQKKKTISKDNGNTEV